MLTLTRKEHEIVYLDLPDGTRVAIEVRSIRGNQVRIAIDAPAEIVILRKEVADAK